MKLTSVPNFRVEDFPTEQSWIGRLFIQLNPLIQTLNQILDNNIDFSTNIKSVSKQYSISSWAAFSFTWPYSSVTPNDLRVTKASKGTAQTPTILLPAWSYDQSTSLITVSSMLEATSSGVASLSGTYQFTVRATV